MTRLNPQAFSLMSEQGAYEELLEQWRVDSRARKIWARDASLWSGTDESDWLGWLDVVSRQTKALDALRAFQDDIARAALTHVVVLGMGGSSLCPEVLGRTLGPIAGHPKLLVIDSTVPGQVLSVENRLDLATTLFIVASKSGSTAEPEALERYFFDRVSEPSHFVAITDPGSGLDRLAKDKDYRAVWYGEPEIGGRFSALSHFGMVPAAAMGVDVEDFLNRAALMVSACGPETPLAENPGVSLGLALGALAANGRDKVTFRTSAPLEPLGGWLEQLIAESTGKSGQGILPVDREPAAPAPSYGSDRVFVVLSLRGSPPPVSVSGHPTISIELETEADIAQEFFRWEMATAVAGAVMGVNPFDQPDVEASKVETRSLLSRRDSSEDSSDADMPKSAGGSAAQEDDVGALVETLAPGDYFAILAYVEPTEDVDALLQSFRHRVVSEQGVATTLGYGPRFLHSTGQLHKGGPDSGVFLQITADDAVDLSIPGKPYSFGELKTSQAQGDLSVLERLGRRVLHVHLEADVASGLRRILPHS